jgi:hypothetical protein
MFHHCQHQDLQDLQKKQDCGKQTSGFALTETNWAFWAIFAQNATRHRVPPPISTF